MKLPAKKTPNSALSLVICLTQQAARTFSWNHINWKRRKDETSKISSKKKDHNFMFEYFVLDIYSVEQGRQFSNRVFEEKSERT